MQFAQPLVATQPMGLTKRILRSNPRLYFVVQSSQLRELLVAEGRSEESVRRLDKRELWKEVTGRELYWRRRKR